MPKKLLILIDKKGEKKKIFEEYMVQKLTDTKVIVTSFADLFFQVQSGKVEIRITGRDEKIRDFDFIHFRRSGRDYLSPARALALCLKAWGVKFSDETFADIGPSGNDKLVDGVRLALADLPVIPFCYCDKTKVVENESAIIDLLGLPLVAKNIFSQRGEGISLVKEKIKQSGKDCLFQKYISSHEEYRILVLGKKIGAYEEKINENPDEFRANVALGARERFIDRNLVPAETAKISFKACRVLNLDVGGVDILVDENKNNWLLEVNRGPGLTYDPNFSPELAGFAEYFKEKLNE